MWLIFFVACHQMWTNIQQNLMVSHFEFSRPFAASMLIYKVDLQNHCLTNTSSYKKWNFDWIFMKNSCFLSALPISSIRCIVQSFARLINWLVLGIQNLESGKIYGWSDGWWLRSVHVKRLASNWNLQKLETNRLYKLLNLAKQLWQGKIWLWLLKSKIWLWLLKSKIWLWLWQRKIWLWLWQSGWSASDCGAEGETSSHPPFNNSMHNSQLSKSKMLVISG